MTFSLENFGMDTPTNPLSDAATNLMTPFIQSIVANQAQKVNRISIKDAVKPVNPVIH